MVKIIPHADILDMTAFLCVTLSLLFPQSDGDILKKIGTKKERFDWLEKNEVSQWVS